MMPGYKPYLLLARFDNWSKNLLMLAGAALAYALSEQQESIWRWPLLWGMAALCLASSANYILNEVIDAAADAHHPLKKTRVAVTTRLDYRVVACEYALFALTALMMAHGAHVSVALAIGGYLAAAWLYNIPPLRLKDRAYLDVLLESFNYPLRLLVGWLCILPHYLPPSTVILTGWAIGAFTMSVKRLAEYGLFESPEAAAKYRRSYRRYTALSLTILSFGCGMLSMFAMTVFLLKYKLEFLLLLPPMILWFSWYLALGLKRDEAIIYPEKLFKKKGLSAFSLVLVLLALLLWHVQMPGLHAYTKPLHFPLP